MGANPSNLKRFVVVAGGDQWTGPAPQLDGNVESIIAADSGVHLALELALAVDVLIGDLDSASPAAIAEAADNGARIVRHPADKDATDLELAMDLAQSEGADEIVVLGGAGGRLSHLLGIAALLASDRYSAVNIKWMLPKATVHVVNAGHPLSVAGEPGDIISLIPMGGEAAGISTAGLKWELAGGSLASSRTRGVSNELSGARAQITVAAGVMLAIHERPEN